MMMMTMMVVVPGVEFALKIIRAKFLFKVACVCVGVRDMW